METVLGVKQDSKALALLAQVFRMAWQSSQDRRSSPSIQRDVGLDHQPSSQRDHLSQLPQNPQPAFLEKATRNE